MTIEFIKATLSDAKTLVDIYNSSFYDDYIKYGECPGYGRTIERMEESIKCFPKYIAKYNNQAVGVISYKNEGNERYFIGCLCVIPQYQRMGIGTSLFIHFKLLCNDWSYISLITPADKKENIKFYTERCGLKIGKSQMDGNVEVVNLFASRNNIQ